MLEYKKHDYPYTLASNDIVVIFTDAAYNSKDGKSMVMSIGGL